MARPVGIDLFAGAGGLGLGFEAAGFDVAAAVEIDPIHRATHEFNFPCCATMRRDVRGLQSADDSRSHPTPTKHDHDPDLPARDPRVHRRRPRCLRRRRRPGASGNPQHLEAVLEYTIEIIRFLIGMAACFTHMPMDSRNLGSYDPFADADTVQTGCGDNTLKVIDSF